ncbi:hypothetical protein Salat_2440500 [Sesamum alatum]|uniref:RNase H type-1 domain-containing protein n=1 Tax=Sesamum alatum TaxID=300844 RepID=A0AAE2CFI4_9LAMI|nr:hypothetical protein Salat_2440500 [Sesamum alatum]
MESSRARGPSHWDFIWKAKVPNRVKKLCWKICKEAVPVTNNLAKRRVSIEDLCPSRKHGGTTVPKKPWIFIWQKPPTHTVKLNFDGAGFRAERGVVFGVIARDEKGKCVGWKMGFLANIYDAMLTEARAARGAADLVGHHRWDNLILEGDNFQICTSLVSQEEDPWTTSPILNETKTILAVVRSVTISFINREGNHAAHCVARAANSGLPRIVLPMNVVAACQVDLLTI